MLSGLSYPLDRLELAAIVVVAGSQCTFEWGMEDVTGDPQRSLAVGSKSPHTKAIETN